MNLNIGCGPILLEGFLNIDSAMPEFGGLYREPDDVHPFLKHDLATGLPEDIAADSVDFINASQFLEHLNYRDGLHLLRHCYKVLKKDGVGRMRISVPDADLLIRAYAQGGLGEFATVQPPEYAYAREGMLKLGMILFGSMHAHGESGHKMAYNFEGLQEMLKNCKFRNIQRMDFDSRFDAEVARNHQVALEATT